MNHTKHRVENWSITKLYGKRGSISFPEYQRQRNLWSDKKKSLLIDSILIDIDIPKLYFNHIEKNSYEVIDGQQRLWAIWGFIDNDYKYVGSGGLTINEPKFFSQLSNAEQQQIIGYKLQVTVFDNATDEYLRELFIRLQLGLLLVTGEKLNAQAGSMKDFIFYQLPKNNFMKGINIPKRRFALENLGAQIAINAFSKHKTGSFARTRYEDLRHFFEEYENPKGASGKIFVIETKRIVTVLNFLAQCLGRRIAELNGRSYILSIYLLTDWLIETVDVTRPREGKKLAEFILAIRKRLKEEAKKGIDRTNREIYELQTMLSSAAGEKYQIERRHNKLVEHYTFYKRNGKIKGDS